MGADILIFFIYFAFNSYVLFLFTRNKKELGSPKLWILVFAWKIVLGIYYGHITKGLEPIADTWQYYENGLRLHAHSFPKLSGKNFNILSADSYFEYFRYIFMDYLSGFFSVLSGARYNVNLIFYNFLVLVGIIRLFQFLIGTGPRYKIFFYLIIGFFPPFVFWTSGFHRDGLCIAALGVFLFNFQNYMHTKSFGFLFWALFAVLSMLFLRSFWGFSTIVVSFIWLISIVKKRIKPMFVFCLGFFVLILLFTISAFTPKPINFASFLIEKQHGFMNLTGESEMVLTRLNLTLTSFLKAIPEALNHLFIRPYPAEMGKSVIYILTFFENIIVWVLLCFAIFYSAKYRNKCAFRKPENNVLLFLVIVNYLIIGLTVPFLGAIIRYRSPFEVLLLIVLIQLIPENILNKCVPRQIQAAFKS